MADLNAMTLEELEELEPNLAEARAALALQHKAVRAAIDARRAIHEAAAKLAGMSDAEKLALAQVLRAQGIESAEKFGKIGAG